MQTKKHRAATNSAWYLAHRAEKIARTSAYRAAHQEEYNKRAVKRRAKDPEKYREYGRQYQKAYRTLNPGIVAKAQEKFEAAHPGYYRSWERGHAVERKKDRKNWYKNNPGMNAFYSASRRSLEKMATPRWVKPTDLKPFYIESARRTRNTGIPHASDHIWPINGDGFTGLNVPWNLRVITKSANSEKKNRRPTADEILQGGII